VRICDEQGVVLASVGESLKAPATLSGKDKLGGRMRSMTDQLFQQLWKVWQDDGVAEEEEFEVGDRVKCPGVVGSEYGEVIKVDREGSRLVRLDGGNEVWFSWYMLRAEKC
jgi:hypothetical protein